MEYILLQLSLLMVSIGTITFASNPPVIRTDAAGEPNQLVKVGELITLPCPVQDQDEVIVSWTKNDETIHRGWQRFKVAKNGGLKIRDAEPDDAGLYMCLATNGFGQDQLEYRLYVAGNDSVTYPPPEIDRNGPAKDDGDSEAPVFTSPESMDGAMLVPVSSTVQLKCVSSGLPRPQIMWYKDGYLLQRGGDEPYQQGEVYGQDARWTLVLRNLRPEDTGRYTCKVSNARGQIEHTYMLEVMDGLAKPEIREPHPLNETVLYGQLASFQCRVHSQVKPIVQWLKRVDSRRDIHKQNKTIDIDGQHFVVLPSSEVIEQEEGVYVNKLIIRSAQHSDAGRYICLGVNSMGTSQRDAFLIVKSSDDSTYSYEAHAESFSLSLILIIAVPSLIVAIVVSVVIYCYCKKSHGLNSPKTVVNSSGNPVPAMMNHSGGGSSGSASAVTSRTMAAPLAGQDKHYYSVVPMCPPQQQQYYHPSYNQQQPQMLHNGNNGAGLVYSEYPPQHHHHNNPRNPYIPNTNTSIYNTGEYASTEYPPLLQPNNNNAGLHHHQNNTNSQQHYNNKPQLVLKNYGEIHHSSDGGSSANGPVAGPHTTTPHNSNSSAASSNHTSPPQGYMSAPTPPGGHHVHNHYA